MKLRSRSNQKNGLGTRTQRQASHVLIDSDSEDIDAKDTGATTLCVLLAAMDSAPTPKAAFLKKLRSCSNQKNGPQT